MTAPDDKTLDDLVRLCRDEEYGTDLSESCADAIAALRERIAELTERSKLDPLSHAWKSGYAQAIEESKPPLAAPIAPDVEAIVAELHLVSENGCDPDLADEAATMLRSLAAENAGLRERINAMEAACALMQPMKARAERVEAKVSALEAERDALRQDAQRYRWLRQNPWWLGWEHDMQAEKIDAALDDDIARAALEGK